MPETPACLQQDCWQLATCPLSNGKSRNSPSANVTESNLPLPSFQVVCGDTYALIFFLDLLSQIFHYEEFVSEHKFLAAIKKTPRTKKHAVDTWDLLEGLCFFFFIFF